MRNTLRTPWRAVNIVLTFTMIGPSRTAPRIKIGLIGAV